MNIDLLSAFIGGIPGLLPVPAFALLDMYDLRLEKGFRYLCQQVRLDLQNVDSNVIPYADGIFVIEIQILLVKALEQRAQGPIHFGKLHCGLPGQQILCRPGSVAIGSVYGA